MRFSLQFSPRTSSVAVSPARSQCLSHHEKSLVHRLTDKSWLPATGASHSTRSENVPKIRAQYRNETPTTLSQCRTGPVTQRGVVGGLAS